MGGTALKIKSAPKSKDFRIVIDIRDPLVQPTCWRLQKRRPVGKVGLIVQGHRLLTYGADTRTKNFWPRRKWRDVPSFLPVSPVLLRRAYDYYPTVEAFYITELLRTHNSMFASLGCAVSLAWKLRGERRRFTWVSQCGRLQGAAEMLPWPGKRLSLHWGQTRLPTNQKQIRQCPSNQPAEQTWKNPKGVCRTSSTKRNNVFSSFQDNCHVYLIRQNNQQGTSSQGPRGPVDT